MCMISFVRACVAEGWRKYVLETKNGHAFDAVDCTVQASRLVIVFWRFPETTMIIAVDLEPGIMDERVPWSSKAQLPARGSQDATVLSWGGVNRSTWKRDVFIQYCNYVFYRLVPSLALTVGVAKYCWRARWRAHNISVARGLRDCRSSTGDWKWIPDSYNRGVCLRNVQGPHSIAQYQYFKNKT